MTRDKSIEKILRKTSRIAVVGLSENPDKDSNSVARYLMLNGFQVIPVNPNYTQVLGLPCYPSLLEIPKDISIDLVDVFRPGEETPGIARQAVEIQAACLWLQLGIRNPEAAKIAAGAGIEFVEDKCIKVEHLRLFH